MALEWEVRLIVRCVERFVEKNLVYLDVVRTFPDMRSSIQYRSSAGDPNYMHADALLNLYIE